MAINKISGNILADNLQRGSDLSIQGNLIYFDVNADRVGIKTSTPGDDLAVLGTANATDIRITSATANRLLYADDNKLAKTSSNLLFDGTSLELTGNLIVDNVTINGTSITSDSGVSLISSNNGNITLQPDGAGIVVIDTTTSLLIPVGNTAQRPDTPATGMIRFNTTTGQVEIYDGVNWETVGSDIAALSDQTITGNGVATQFTLDQSATATSIIVSTNGVVQKPNTAYTVTGNIIDFSEAPLSSDVIDVRFIATLQTITAISNSSGNNSIRVDENGVGNTTTLQSLQLPSYTVTQANGLANVASGQIIYVSNGDSGNPCLAVYSIDAWKIVALGGNITP